MIASNSEQCYAQQVLATAFAHAALPACKYQDNAQQLVRELVEPCPCTQRVATVVLVFYHLLQGPAQGLTQSAEYKLVLYTNVTLHMLAGARPWPCSVLCIGLGAICHAASSLGPARAVPWIHAHARTAYHNRSQSQRQVVVQW